MMSKKEIKEKFALEIDALIALLRARIKIDRKKTPWTSNDSSMIIHWHWGDFDTPILSKEEIYLDGIKNDAIYGALNMAIRQVGQRIFEKANTQAMIDVCYICCSKMSKNQDRAASIISHKWDGIGSWHA